MTRHYFGLPCIQLSKARCINYKLDEQYSNPLSLALLYSLIGHLRPLEPCPLEPHPLEHLPWILDPRSLELEWSFTISCLSTLEVHHFLPRLCSTGEVVSPAKSLLLFRLGHHLPWLDLDYLLLWHNY